MRNKCGDLLVVTLLMVFFSSLAHSQDAAKTPEATNTKTKTAASDPESKSAEGDSEKKEAEKSFIRKFEDDVNAVAGKAVDGIASVFFFPIIGGKTFEHEYDGAITTVDGIQKMIDDAQAKGINPVEAEMSIKLPHGSLSKDEAKAFKKELSEKFTERRGYQFSVKVAKADDELTGTKFVAKAPKVPIVVLWLVLGAIFFTIRMNFVNIRAFKHALQVTAGKFDNPDDEGEVNHFQALTSALSATVGLGNIAGVALAIGLGGPGATFWMIVAGALGMTSKFVECTLGQMYRSVREDGRIMGGPMYYLSRGLGELNPGGLNLGGLGKVLAVMFAVLCVLASFGGGNAFQVNQSAGAVEATFEGMKGQRWIYGLIMTGAVGIVIIGGIKRIAAAAEKIVPTMCGLYVMACLWILLMNIGDIPAAFGTIFSQAFTAQAGWGGLLGVLVMGFQRAAFSNEAGVGSAAIAHSAAKTDYPIREGTVALLGPFIDTIVVCTMTALVIVITGAYENPEWADLRFEKNGAGLTSAAMGSQVTWFPYVLTVAVVLFAYSTMISWSYYGERCFVYLFGDRSSMTYRVIFLVFVFLGSVMSATAVLDLSDLMILGMAFPNILGVVLLSGKVKRAMIVYFAKLKAGDFDR